MQRDQLADERTLGFSLGVRHAAGNVALAGREQHPKIVGAHSLGRFEGGGGVAILSLQQRERGECRRRVARDWRRGTDLRNLEQSIDRGDSFSRRADCFRTVAEVPQRLGLGDLRAPENVVIGKRRGHAAGVARRVERGGVRAAPGECPG